MEELEYIPKRIYQAKITRLNEITDIKGAQLICVSGDPNNKMESPCIQIDNVILPNGQQQINTIMTAFPIYNSEIQYWPPGKKVKITVEVVD